MIEFIEDKKGRIKEKIKFMKFLKLKKEKIEKDKKRKLEERWKE